MPSSRWLSASKHVTFRYPKTCENCGKDYEATRSWQKRCPDCMRKRPQSPAWSSTRKQIKLWVDVQTYDALKQALKGQTIAQALRSRINQIISEHKEHNDDSR